MKSTIYWFEIESGSIWRTGWHTPTIWDLNSYFNFSVLTILRATASVKNRECKTHLKSLWIAFKMKKNSSFQSRSYPIEGFGEQNTSRPRGGKRVQDPTLQKGLVTLALSET